MGSCFGGNARYRAGISSKVPAMTITPGMVERVARALAADDGLDPDGLRPDRQRNWEPYCSNARAVIKAHQAALADAGLVIVPREPRGRMLRAGHRAHTADRGSGFYFDTQGIYSAMINAALEPTKDAITADQSEP